jgi:hypothetical protein
MRNVRTFRLLAWLALTLGLAPVAVAQDQGPTRQGTIEEEQAEKSKDLRPYVPNKAEAVMNKVQGILNGYGSGWHPFFDNAYSGGGFTLGAGYNWFVGSYSRLDVRGSYTIANYKRLEAEFVAPRLFHRRGQLSILGGWREAPEVGFYGVGTNTSQDDRVNYLFRQPYLSGLLEVKPTRRNLVLIGGVEWSRWTQDSGEGSFPAIDTVYTPQTLPGVGAEVTYLHSRGTVGFDWRTSPGYSRRGGFYGVTFHDYADRDKDFGFEQYDYEAIQHIPILREAWVISLRGLARTTNAKSDQTIPFFMLPSVGGGSSLRGYSSWRFRDRNSILFQAEWRIMANRYLDSAVFMDAGKVTPHSRDLNFDGLKTDYGFGVRFHGPFVTPLRVEIAKSPEGLSLVFSTSAPF